MFTSFLTRKALHPSPILNQLKCQIHSPPLRMPVATRVSHYPSYNKNPSFFPAVLLIKQYSMSTSFLTTKALHSSPISNQLQHPMLSRQYGMPTTTRVAQPFHVFINHRGIDTKQNVASLLYDHLVRFKIHPFLDYKSLKPGDKLIDKINASIKESKIAVVIFSPNYCESYFCLYELSLIMEEKKKVIPIFCDVKPSQLRFVNNGSMSKKKFQRFNLALEEAKDTVGLTFNSLKGNWSEMITSAAEIVKDNLIELKEEQFESQINPGIILPKKH